MLDERIKKFSSIGTEEDLLFCLQLIRKGVCSIETLHAFVQSTSGHLTLNVQGVLLLLSSLNYIHLESDGSFQMNDTYSSFWNDHQHYIEKISEDLISLMYKENIFDLSAIHYDQKLSKYVMLRGIPMSYACLRNVLINIHALIKVTGSKYICSDLLVNCLKQDQFKALKKKKTIESLMKDLEREREQGDEGEKFVMRYEKKRIANKILVDQISQISLIDVGAGYDVISFNSSNSLQYDRFIEVKTYVGEPHFYWSSNEIQSAKLLNDQYYLYLVDYTKTNQESYEPIIIQNPFDYFRNCDDWSMQASNYFIQHFENK